VNEPDMYDYEEEEDLPEIDEVWAKDLNRLRELKEQKAYIDEEIAYLNAKAAEDNIHGLYTDADGVTHKVTLRQDSNAPRVTNAKELRENHPELWMEIATVQVDTKKLKDAIKRGYFSGTEASRYMSQTQKRPWLQITPLAKETEDTHE